MAFYWSEVSQTGGPSGPLLKELTNRGIGRVDLSEQNL